MAIQSRQAILKLADDDPKTLGVGHLTARLVTCAQGLVEGVDFEITRPNGLIRRLKPFGRELYTFLVEYDDQSETKAADEAAKTAKDVGVKMAKDALAKVDLSQVKAVADLVPIIQNILKAMA